MTDSRPLAVFDLDNTLADTGHRQRFLEGGRRDWEGFFGAASDDPPIGEGVAFAVACAQECEVVYLTGRPERCRQDTVEWLARHGLPEGRVFMRRNDDRRPARQMKMTVLRRVARGRVVRVVVDDDELVCAEVERAGFSVVRARWVASSEVLGVVQEGEGRT
ncbi:hypothetical protein ABZX85_09065 [Streptomyces sp. NPDC004539]|uniref:phosphatase domain-containing protein n=1 Tax=Streptomyces sp. NPDC004539 TaxID=3154280 RepID=UPI0033A0088F